MLTPLHKLLSLQLSNLNKISLVYNIPVLHPAPELKILVWAGVMPQVVQHLPSKHKFKPQYHK
jgi:hypothetical protein